MIGVSTVECPDSEDEDEHTHFEEVANGDVRAHSATLFKVGVAPARPLRRRTFQAQDYSFGYLSCKNCHNDQAYYIHHADLDAGYTFRCRVCRMEITVTSESLAQN
jgi:hypothetical protein